MRGLAAAALAGLCAAAAAGTAAVPGAFERFSLLTPAGPDEPRPEVLAGAKRVLWAEHRVLKGEYWAGSVAKKYGTTLQALQATNGNEYYVMLPGQRMTVLNRDGKLYEVRKAGETLDSVVARFRSQSREPAKLKEAIVRVNDLPGVAMLEPYEFSPGERLVIPDVRVAFDSYHFPFEGFGIPRTSSRFGVRYHPLRKVRKFHEGLDLPKPYGTPVYPAKAGRVLEAGWHEGYGQLIVVRHENGDTTRYGHLSKISVQEGEVVGRKTMLGRVGSTGISTGPHLHFEIRNASGRPVDPRATIISGKR